MTQEMDSQWDRRPVPDPTSLTDKAIAKAQAATRDFIGAELRVRDERLSGMDGATKLRLRIIDDVPHRIDEKVGHLQAVQDEKFRSIATQFIERDTRSEREARDNKVAVDAAFAAQKEAATKQDEANQKAIDKSEKTTLETINKLGDLVDTNIRAQADKIDDLKDARAEDMRQIRQAIADVATTANGTVQQKIGAKEDRTGLYLAIGALCSILLVAVAILVFIAAHLP